MNMSRKQRDVRSLSRAGFKLWLDEEYDFVIVDGVRLPPGYNMSSIPLLIELPATYPLAPPGIAGSLLFVPRKLRFGRRQLEDIHERVTPTFETPGWNAWAWMCYENLEWDPFRDNLITFVEMVRTDLTDPKT